MGLSIPSFHPLSCQETEQFRPLVQASSPAAGGGNLAPQATIPKDMPSDTEQCCGLRLSVGDSFAVSVERLKLSQCFRDNLLDKWTKVVGIKNDFHATVLSSGLWN
jgi:hypothetical protein